MDYKLSSKASGKDKQQGKKGSCRQKRHIFKKNPSYGRVRKSKRTVNGGRLTVRTCGSKPRKSLRNSFQEALIENMGSVKHIKSKKGCWGGPGETPALKTKQNRSSKEFKAIAES